VSSDAVECIKENCCAGKSAIDAIAYGNMLIEYGVIQHVVSEHWLKNKKDLFFCLGDGSSLCNPEMTPFHSFIMHHLRDGTRGLLKHQISAALDHNFAVTYLPEDFRFGIRCPSV